MDSPVFPHRRTVALWALAMAPAFGARAFDLSAKPLTDAPTVHSTQVLDSAGRLTVNARVNGNGPYPFMIDTGASASVIANDLVAALNLKADGTTKLHGIAGVQTADTVKIDEISIGRRTRRDLVMTLLPAGQLEASGILGLDWLGSQGLLLNFIGDEMSVGAGQPYSDGRTISVPVGARRSGLSLLRGDVPGGHVLAFVDTGSTTTVGNLALMNLALANRGIVGDWSDTILRSVTGQILPGRFAQLRSLELGAVRMRNVPVVFGQVHTFAYWGIDDRPAMLIGADVLRAFASVSLDFSRGQVHFRVRDTRGT
ncbi:aspartyl protease family protein [Caulobacter sp.]|uniref:aspartyl protease family protein n=1 Tax=Caulobacter sp. TaxID=78 RepID=UPI003BB214C6